jgi:uncharacterized DUF497 family protein
MPIFEYDPDKSEANRAKHGIDFEDAQALWNDENAIEKQTRYPGEARFFRIGSIGTKIWAAVFTYRGDRVRLISVRPAGYDERQFYRDARAAADGGGD